MPRAVVCPDKLKGTLSAPEAAAAMSAGLRRAGWEDVVERPLADGGEGTIDAIRAARGGQLRSARVTGPLGDPVDASWLVLADGTAVVETARAVGLQLVTGERDALRASSRGAGELIRAAASAGARRIVVGVGGSAMTDGGLAAVEVLGWSLRGLDVTVACDVRTRFVDAAAAFGPQKGATAAQVQLLTRRLEQIADQYEQRLGVEIRACEGGGAAGGLAGGLAALGAELDSGFEAVADAVGLGEALEGAALVVTGEGRLDQSSFEGKVVGGVLEWSAEEGVAGRAVIAGQVAAGLEVPEGVVVQALVDRAFQAGEAFVRAGLLVEEAALEIGREMLKGI
ncbi:MAG: glycerate kinase [Acidimicrobiia bacterium]